MGKRRIDQIAGRDPWEVETDYWIKQIKQYRKDLPDPIISTTARSLVISLWMAHGDLRPLAAAIRSHLRNPKGSGPKVHEVFHLGVLGLLAEMIEKGELSVKRRGRRNRQQGIFARDVLMLHLREHAKKSEEEIADELHMETEAVHQALIKARKARSKGLARWTGTVK
jgi:hypothetical protein